MGLFLDALGWLADSANWSGTNGVVARSVEHLLLTGASVLIACAVAIPIALWLGHESPSTTHMYVEADLAMKERALARLKQPGIKRARYRAPKGMMDFLRSL